jgi:hypothetical protein
MYDSVAKVQNYNFFYNEHLCIANRVIRPLSLLVSFAHIVVLRDAGAILEVLPLRPLLFCMVEVPSWSISAEAELLEDLRDVRGGPPGDTQFCQQRSAICRRLSIVELVSQLIRIDSQYASLI